MTFEVSYHWKNILSSNYIWKCVWYSNGYLLKLSLPESLSKLNHLLLKLHEDILKSTVFLENSDVNEHFHFVILSSNIYSPFIIGVLFTGEVTTVCCHQFTGS
jgi:hypothetical protein